MNEYKKINHTDQTMNTKTPLPSQTTPVTITTITTTTPLLQPIKNTLTLHPTQANTPLSIPQQKPRQNQQERERERGRGDIETARP